MDIPGSDDVQQGRDIPDSFASTMPTSTQLLTPQKPRTRGAFQSPEPSQAQADTARYTLSPLAKSIKKPTPKKTPINEDELDVPEKDDPNAQRPALGELHITDQAIRMRTQRIFKRHANGTLKVSETVFAEWHERGSRRKLLEQFFHQCGYDPVSSATGSMSIA